MVDRVAKKRFNGRAGNGANFHAAFPSVMMRASIGTTTISNELPLNQLFPFKPTLALLQPSFIERKVGLQLGVWDCKEVSSSGIAFFKSNAGLPVLNKPVEEHLSEANGVILHQNP